MDTMNSTVAKQGQSTTGSHRQSHPAVPEPNRSGNPVGPLSTTSSSTESPNGYPCRACNKPFKTLSERDQHEQYHASRRHRCQHCRRAFTRPGDMKRHMITHDPQHPQFFCPVANCPGSKTSFARVDSLKRHVAQQHVQVSMQSASDQGRLATPPTPLRSRKLDEYSAMSTSTRNLCDDPEFVQLVDTYLRESNAKIGDVIPAADAFIELSKHASDIGSEQDWP